MMYDFNSLPLQFFGSSSGKNLSIFKKNNSFENYRSRAFQRYPWFPFQSKGSWRKTALKVDDSNLGPPFIYESGALVPRALHESDHSKRQFDSKLIVFGIFGRCDYRLILIDINRYVTIYHTMHICNIWLSLQILII